MTRLFVAVELDDKIKESIISSCAAFSDDVLKAKYTSIENMHLTMKFIGEWPFNDIIDIIDILNDVKKTFTPFDMKFEGMGGFPNEYNPRIIWVGCISKEIIGLVNSIEQNLSKLGIKKEQRSFSPHITIARVKNVLNRDDVNDIIKENKDTAFGSQRVDRFYLKESQLTPRGPIYSNLEVFNL